MAEVVHVINVTHGTWPIFLGNGVKLDLGVSLLASLPLSNSYDQIGFTKWMAMLLNPYWHPASLLLQLTQSFLNEVMSYMVMASGMELKST